MTRRRAGRGEGDGRRVDEIIVGVVEGEVDGNGEGRLVDLGGRDEERKDAVGVGEGRLVGRRRRYNGRRRFFCTFTGLRFTSVCNGVPESVGSN